MKARQPRGSAFIRLHPLEVAAALFVIWLVAVVVAWAAFQQGRFSLLPVYASFVLYLTILSLPVVLPGHDSGFFNPVVFFVLCHGMIALLRSDAALASGLLHGHRAMPYMDQAGLDATVAKTFFLKTLSLVGLYAGYSLTPYLRFRRLPVVRAKALSLKAVLWVGLSAIGVMVLSMKGGSIGSLLLQRGIPSADRISAAGAHWHFLAGIGTIVPPLWLAFRPPAIRSLLYWAVTLSSIFFMFAARGSRSNALIVVILIGMVWMLQNKKIPYKVIFAGIALTVVFLGGVSKFREATRGEETLGDVELESDMSTAFASGIEQLSSRGIDDNGQIAVVGRVPDQVDYLYGRSYLSIPFVFIPSALLGGQKPPTAGRLNALLVHERRDTAIPSGAVGEAYWNFSYAGPVLVFLVYGGILKLIAGVYLQNRDNPVVLSFYVYVLYRFLPGSDPAYDFIQALVPALAFLAFVAFPFGQARRVRGRGQAILPVQGQAGLPVLHHDA